MSVPNVRPEPTRQAESLDRRDYELERRRLPEPDHWWWSTGRELLGSTGAYAVPVLFGVEYPQQPVPVKGMNERPAGDPAYGTYPIVDITVDSWTMQGNFYVGATLVFVYAGQIGRGVWAHWIFGGFV